MCHDAELNHVTDTLEPALQTVAPPKSVLAERDRTALTGIIPVLYHLTWSDLETNEVSILQSPSNAASSNVDPSQNHR